MYMLGYIVVLLIFAIAVALSRSKNKTNKTIGFGLIILGLIVFAYIRFGSIIVFNPIFIILYIAILFGVIAFIYRKYRNLKYQKESYEDINYLNRDLSTEYPPSIVGYLFNQKLRYKDLIADIMELYAQKIINISKSNEQGKTRIHFYLQEEDYRNKISSQSQLYIINTLINDNSNRKFDYRTWKQYVLEEYKIRKFAKEKNEDKSKKIIFITIICKETAAGFKP